MRGACSVGMYAPSGALDCQFIWEFVKISRAKLCFFLSYSLYSVILNVTLHTGRYTLVTVLLV